MASGDGRAWGFFGKLGDAVVVKLYARDVKSNLANAKTLLEA